MTHDDLRTTNDASSSLKKTKRRVFEFSGLYGFKYDKRNRAFMPTSGSVISFDQTFLFMLIKALYQILLAQVYINHSLKISWEQQIYLSAINGLNNDDVRLNEKFSSKRMKEVLKISPVDGSDHIGEHMQPLYKLLRQNLPNFLPEDSKTDVSLFYYFH